MYLSDLNLKTQYNFVTEYPIIQSFLVDDEWNDKIYLFITENEFIFFRWDTTA
jgi:hypothetical protein